MWEGVIAERKARQLMRAVESGVVKLDAKATAQLALLCPSDGLRVSGRRKDYGPSIHDLIRSAETPESLQEMYEESVKIPMKPGTRKRVREAYMARRGELKVKSLVLTADAVKGARGKVTL